MGGGCLLSKLKLPRTFLCDPKYDVGFAHLLSCHKPIVYFLSAKGSDRIKIGTSTNFKHRLYNLNCSNPFILELIHFEYGGERHEKRLHLLFEKWHIKNEWFHESDEILQYTAERGFMAYYAVDHILDLEDKNIDCGLFVTRRQLKALNDATFGMGVST
jgi:hypothetical protein